MTFSISSTPAKTLQTHATYSSVALMKFSSQKKAILVMKNYILIISPQWNVILKKNYTHPRRAIEFIKNVIKWYWIFKQLEIQKRKASVNSQSVNTPPNEIIIHVILLSSPRVCNQMENLKHFSAIRVCNFFHRQGTFSGNFPPFRYEKSFSLRFKPQTQLL